MKTYLRLGQLLEVWRDSGGHFYVMLCFGKVRRGHEYGWAVFERGKFHVVIHSPNGPYAHHKRS
jgi:hypothetical protein